MIFNCKVVGLQDGSEFTDGLRRVTLRVAEADLIHHHFRVPVRPGEGLESVSLGDTIKLSGVVEEESDDIFLLPEGVK